MKTLKIADLRERILLVNTEWKIDKELNRIEKNVPVQEVWANIEAKSSNYENTDAGTKPLIKYKVTIRKNEAEFVKVFWKDKYYEVLQPRYSDLKYTYFEMSGIHGEKHIATEFS